MSYVAVNPFFNLTPVRGRRFGAEGNYHLIRRWRCVDKCIPAREISNSVLGEYRTRDWLMAATAASLVTRISIASLRFVV